jgi:hypothetical protein
MGRKRSFLFVHPHRQLPKLLLKRKWRCVLNELPCPPKNSARFSDWLVAIPLVEFKMLVSFVTARRIARPTMMDEQTFGLILLTAIQELTQTTAIHGVDTTFTKTITTSHAI